LRYLVEICVPITTRAKQTAPSKTAIVSLFALAILLGFPGVLTPAFARASAFEEKVWDPGNIDSLPPEVRSALTRMCGPDLAAQQYFAGYYRNSKFLVLHFGRFRCGNLPPICAKGRCLHQVYRKVGDRYRFVRSYYGPDDD
jgi:hypothetical protein